MDLLDVCEDWLDLEWFDALDGFDKAKREPEPTALRNASAGEDIRALPPERG